MSTLKGKGNSIHKAPEARKFVAVGKRWGGGFMELNRAMGSTVILGRSRGNLKK